MRRLFTSLLAALILFAAALTSSAQPYYRVPPGVFNHWAAGGAVGTDGVSVLVATAAFRHIEVRGGFTRFIPASTTQLATVSFDSPWRYHAKTGLTSSWGSFHGFVLLDIFPKSTKEFRFTLGFHAGGGDGYFRRQLAEPFPASDVPFTEQSYTLPSRNAITADSDGYLRFSADRRNVRPYVGIGMGHCISDTRPWQVGLDAGFLYVGHRTVNGYDYSDGNPVKVPLTGEDIDDVESRVFDLTAHLIDYGLLGLISRCPVQPVIRITVTYRLF